MNINTYSGYFVILLFAGFFAGCTGGNGENATDGAISSKRAGINEVIIHETANPDKLNPITSTSANSSFIEGNMFMALMSIDPDSFHYLPILAVSRPEIVNIEEGEYKGGQTISYEIRPEAEWDNGEPVTAYDVEFTLKAIKNPHVDCGHLRPYYEYIDDIKIDPENPKKFTFYCNDRYFMAEIWSAVTVYPEYLYDPDKLMRNYTVKQLNSTSELEKVRGDKELIQFAENFNSEKYQREKEFVRGCGPYELEEWVTSQRIVLTKKKDWWGDALKGKVKGFEANPDKIVYQIITDPTTAVTALKDEGHDVQRSFKTKDFVDLKENEKVKQLYALYTPMELAFTYIGLNMNNPKLLDGRVREALAHAIDKDYIIDVLYYGLADQVVGPINPSKNYYNDNIEPHKFDLETAKELLKEAGWEDTDGDGIVDKVINGRTTPLQLEYKYSQGSSTAENIGLMFKNNLEKIGVRIELTQREWTVFLEDMKAHNFEMYAGAWISAPTLDDLKQIWHTTSYDDGSNYVGFGNAETDQLIEKIRYELDEAKRKDMYFKFQEIVHDEVPYIFLLTPKNKLAIHKRFENADPKVARPGYVEIEFRLNPSFGQQAVAQY